MDSSKKSIQEDSLKRKDAAGSSSKPSGDGGSGSSDSGESQQAPKRIHIMSAEQVPEEVVEKEEEDKKEEEEDSDFLALSLAVRPSSDSPTRARATQQQQQQQQPPATGVAALLAFPLSSPRVSSPPRALMVLPPQQGGSGLPASHHDQNLQLSLGTLTTAPNPTIAEDQPPLPSASHSIFSPVPVDNPALTFGLPGPPLPPVGRLDQGGSSASGSGSSSRPRARRNPTQAPREGKSETVPALWPWATTSRATVHSLEYLRANNIDTITGTMECRKCEQNFDMSLDLLNKFMEVGSYIAQNRDSMHDRAPAVWMNPTPVACRLCNQENSARPVVAEKKREINWLFLLLGQWLGFCTLEQLKYFCKHTKHHRTGAKDRVLYLTYLGLCKQLDPSGPFDR